jgi:hypothetical protein
MAEDKGYEEVERDADFIPLDEKVDESRFLFDGNGEVGVDGKIKEVDEYGNSIEHGFLGPRGRRCC